MRNNRYKLAVGMLLVGLLAVLLTGCGQDASAPETTASGGREPTPQELLPQAFFSKELRAAEFMVALHTGNKPSDVSTNQLSTGDHLEAVEYALSILREANNRWKIELASGKFRDRYTTEELQTIDDATRRMAEAAKGMWESYAGRSWSGDTEYKAIANLRWAQLELEMIDIASESRSLAGQVKMYRLPLRPTPTPRTPEGDARRTEFQNVSAAVVALMVENGLATIPNPVGSVSGATCTGHTNNMGAFPDVASTLASKAAQLGGTWAAGDKLGYLLFSHDKTGNSSAAALSNYVSFQNAKYYYTVTRDGTVSQCDAAGILFNERTSAPWPTSTATPTPLVPAIPVIPFVRAPKSAATLTPQPPPPTAISTLVRLPEFIVTELSQIKSEDRWRLSGTIRQKEPVNRSLQLSRLMVVFCNSEGRAVEWRVPESGPLNALVEPFSFSLKMASATWKDSGWGFKSFQEFRDTARVCQVVAQILESRYYLKYAENHYTGEFQADLSTVDPLVLYEKR